MDNINPDTFGQIAIRHLVEKLDDVNVLESYVIISQFGDLMNHRLPRNKSVVIPLDEMKQAEFEILDGDFSLSKEKLDDYFIEPAMEDLANEIKSVNKGSIKFAKLATAPSGTGAHSSSYGFNNIEVRCTMQYIGISQGMKVTFDTVFGSVDLDKCTIRAGKTAVIRVGDSPMVQHHKNKAILSV